MRRGTDTTAAVRIAPWDQVCRIRRRSPCRFRSLSPGIDCRRVRSCWLNRCWPGCTTNIRWQRQQRAHKACRNGETCDGMRDAIIAEHTPRRPYCCAAIILPFGNEHAPRPRARRRPLFEHAVSRIGTIYKFNLQKARFVTGGPPDRRHTEERNRMSKSVAPAPDVIDLMPRGL